MEDIGFLQEQVQTMLTEGTRNKDTIARLTRCASALSKRIGCIKGCTLIITKSIGCLTLVDGASEPHIFRGCGRLSQTWDFRLSLGLKGVLNPDIAASGLVCEGRMMTCASSATSCSFS